MCLALSLSLSLAFGRAPRALCLCRTCHAAQLRRGAPHGGGGASGGWCRATNVRMLCFRLRTRACLFLCVLCAVAGVWREDEGSPRCGRRSRSRGVRDARREGEGDERRCFETAQLARAGGRRRGGGAALNSASLARALKDAHTNTRLPNSLAVLYHALSSSRLLSPERPSARTHRRERKKERVSKGAVFRARARLLPSSSLRSDRRGRY